VKIESLTQVKATEAAEKQKQENKQNVLRKQTPCNPVAATLRPGFFFVTWAAAQKLQVRLESSLNFIPGLLPLQSC
jgi:hypothetical protein